MKGNFAPALARILVYEGGKANNPKDPGGKTNFGITQRSYNSWRTVRGLAFNDVYLITHDEVVMIYKQEYWDRISGDALPTGMDLVVFDGAVNSGVGTSVMWLQGSLGVDMDGGLGTKTLAAAQAADDEQTINEYCQRRLGSLERLKTWTTFGAGWTARISNCQKIGDAWAEAGASVNVGPPPVIVSDIGGHNKANMSDVKVSPISVVAAHAVTAGGAVTTGATQAIGTLTGVSDTFAWIKYIVGGLTVASALAGLAVMFGQKANDNAANGVRKSPVPAGADDGLTSVPITDAVVTTDATAAGVVQAHVDTLATQTPKAA